MKLHAPLFDGGIAPSESFVLAFKDVRKKSGARINGSEMVSHHKIEALDLTTEPADKENYVIYENRKYSSWNGRIDTLPWLNS